MNEITDGNGKVEYGKLLQKVEDIAKGIEERNCDIREIQRGLNDLVSRENAGCSYSRSIETRLRVIEDWKATLNGKIYIIVGLVCFASTVFTMVFGQLLLKVLNLA